MRKLFFGLGGAVAIIAIVLLVVSMAVAQSPDSQPGGAQTQVPRSENILQGSDSQPNGSEIDSVQGENLLQGDDSQPSGSPQVIIPKRYRPSTENLNTTAAPVPTETIYFTPQDEDTSTTVLFLYNTSAITQTVGLQTFQLNGKKYIDTSIKVPAHNLVRICADTVSTISASWQDVVLVNFRTSSTYAKMSLPSGIKAEGYVVWNNSNTYDPLKVAPTLSLRFSTDPPTIFLPTSMKSSP